MNMKFQPTPSANTPREMHHVVAVERESDAAEHQQYADEYDFEHTEALDRFCQRLEVSNDSERRGSDRNTTASC